METKTPGIDYGRGSTNIDTTNGIRYGVISINSLHETIHDELEPDYGDPTCPKCGEDVREGSIDDLFCENCNQGFRSDECYSDEAISFSLENTEYSTHSAFDNTCLFLTKSPYYTLTAFCSPCAPGAGDLDSPCVDGVKTYCFGHDMFKDNRAPYPVYLVADNSLVNP